MGRNGAERRTGSVTSFRLEISSTSLKARPAARCDTEIRGVNLEGRNDVSAEKNWPSDISRFSCVHCMVEEPSPKPDPKRQYRFSTVGQALIFWFLNNPADRQKPSMWASMKEDLSGQVFDPEARAPKLYVDDGLHRLDVWHKITIAVRDVLHYHGGRSREIFTLYWKVGDDSRPRRRSKEDIADELGLTVRRVNQLLKAVTDDIEEKLIAQELLAPREFDA
jgi:hypothetical protein